MNDFSVTDAAFTGFRVVKEHFRALPWWALLAIVWAATVNLGSLVLGVQMPDTVSLQTDPTQALALLGRLAPLMLAIFLASLILNAILCGAMNRMILKEDAHKWGYVRLGVAEAKQFGVLLIVILLLMALYFAGAIGVAVAVALATTAGKIAEVVIGAMSVATVLCVLVVLAVRFSLASAATFDRGHIDLSKSWQLTKGHFWPILGTYVLAAALALVVLLLAWLVELELGALVTGGHMQSFVSGQPETLAAFADPIYLFRLVLGSLINALIWPLLLTPAPVIYRHLAVAPRATASAAAGPFGT